MATQTYYITYKKPNGETVTESGTASLKVNTETTVAPAFYAEETTSSSTETPGTGD